MNHRKGEDTIRALGVYATHKGYFFLTELVEQLLNGVPYSTNLLRDVALHHHTTVVAVHCGLRTVRKTMMQNVPNVYFELFGDGPVSTAHLVRTVAEYAAQHQ